MDKVINTPPDVTIQETKNGTMVFGPGHRFQPGSKPANMITAENSPALHRARQEKFRKAAAKAVLEQVQTVKSSVTIPYHAWGYVVGDQVQKLLGAKKANAQVSEFIGRSIGAFVPASEQREQGEGAPTDDIRTVLAQLAEIAKAINHGNG
jgi:hypothetical protein